MVMQITAWAVLQLYFFLLNSKVCIHFHRSHSCIWAYWCDRDCIAHLWILTVKWKPDFVEENWPSQRNSSPTLDLWPDFLAQWRMGCIVRVRVLHPGWRSGLHRVLFCFVFLWCSCCTWPHGKIWKWSRDICQGSIHLSHVQSSRNHLWTEFFKASNAHIIPNGNLLL